MTPRDDFELQYKDDILVPGRQEFPPIAQPQPTQVVSKGYSSSSAYHYKEQPFEANSRGHPTRTTGAGSRDSPDVGIHGEV